MPSKVCQNCNGENIEEDPGRGEAVCTDCGTVLAENIIVADNNFQDNGAGAHSLIGHVVSAEGGHRGGLSYGIHGVSGKDSREFTIDKARQRIKAVASVLRITENKVDCAVNFYRMAVSRGLTKGRKSSHVAAACLYMTCRIEGTSHLLMDFSDVLSVNVFDLGRTFSILAQKLHIKIPLIDPCLYIPRFASYLHFGEKQQPVINMACRLVQRMQRDWIAFGRRPTGVCGAALLLSARYHNFNRSLTDIVKIVNIGEAVLRKRLLEFAATPSSSLTLDEFQTVDLESEEDPPAFRLARQKLKQQQEVEIQVADAMQDELMEAEQEIEQAIADSNKKKRGTTPCPSPFPSTRRATPFDPEMDQANQFVQDELLSNVVRPEDLPNGEISTLDRYREFAPTLESLGIGNQDSNIPSTSWIEDGISNDPLRPHDNDDGSLCLDDLNDTELEGYLLNDAEVAMKTKIWMSANGRFVKDLEEKRRLKREQEEKDNQDPAKKKVKRKKVKVVQGATASEAIERVIKEKRISTKINYEVLRSLTTPTPTSTPTVPPSISSMDTVGGDWSRFLPIAQQESTSLSTIAQSSPDAQSANSSMAVPEITKPMVAGSESSNIDRKPIVKTEPSRISRKRAKPKISTNKSR